MEALTIVAEYAPKEPPVHALLGQVHHRRGDLQLALRHFNIAMDLDPKEAASLKVSTAPSCCQRLQMLIDDCVLSVSLCRPRPSWTIWRNRRWSSDEALLIPKHC